MGDTTLTAATAEHTSDQAAAEQQPKTPATVVFSMPETVMPSMWLTDYDSLYYNEMHDYWEPPVDRQLLANNITLTARIWALSCIPPIPTWMPMLKPT